MIVFFLPIWIKLALPLISVMLFLWIIEGRWRNVVIEVRQNRFAQLIILFWILHLIGVIYSNNWKYGLNDVQQKLSLIIFPIAILTTIEKDGIQINKIVKYFLLGSILSGIVILSNAFINSIHISSFQLVFNPIPLDDPYYNYFRYTKFSFLVHPTYLAMYFTFSIAILFKLIKENIKVTALTVGYFTLIIFFVVLVYLLSSRIGIVSTIVTILVGINWLLIERYKWLLKIGAVVFIVLTVAIVFLNINRQSVTLDKVKENIFLKFNPRKSEFNNAYDPRFYIWQCVPSVMKNNIVFGHGTGDSHIALNREYQRRGLTAAYKNDYNIHNQFFESFISLGLMGLSVLLLLIVYPIYSNYKSKEGFLPILFLLIITLNFMAESMLLRISGILFFAIFYSLFFCTKSK